jgi:hypothetical protein
VSEDKPCSSPAGLGRTRGGSHGAGHDTGRLRDDPEAIREIHDEVTMATKEMVFQAGDISNRV